MELGEVRPARQHFERTLALLGSSMPASTLGWLDVLASQALQRRLWRLRPGGVVERGEERRIRAGERAATCWQMGEACYVLEDWSPLLPLALFGLNQADRAGRPDLTARAQIGVGLITGIAGLRRLSRRQVRAAVSANAAHHELGRHLAAGQRSPLGLDRTGHLDRARSNFAALGCRTDPTGPIGAVGRHT